MEALSRGAIERIARRHFGDLGEEAVATAVAIALAESGGDPSAVNDNYPRWQAADSPYRWDRGLMQINSIHGYAAEALANPDVNMAAARRIYDVQGWNAWTSFRWGTYRAHYQPSDAARATLPPALGLGEWYQVLTDAFYPAYRGDQDARVEPIGYRVLGERRYRVYELLVSE